jgi:LmbE family N-acetylglucosaminyl deacetylase
MIDSGKSAPFNPADPGTPETAWAQLLHDAPKWSPQRGPLIVAAPHPDDEVLGAGGLIQSWAADAQSVTILSVTDGEAADPQRQGLDLIRRKELRNAMRALTTLHVTIKRVAIPDGKVGDHANRLRNALADHVTANATLIAPYELDGHPDHEIVGRVCVDVARAARVPLARYPVWTWHHTDPTAVKSLRWVRFSLTAAAQRAKAHALQCFESQLRPTSGLPIVPAHVLAYFQRPYEAFVL